MKGLSTNKGVKVLIVIQIVVSSKSFSNPGFTMFILHVCACTYILGLRSETTVYHMGLRLFVLNTWSVPFLINMLFYTVLNPSSITTITMGLND